MYVALHNRSAYSFGSALTMPKQLAKFAKQHHMPAIALTDRSGLYAAVMFQHACRKAGIKPIIGAELSLSVESCPKLKEPQALARADYHMERNGNELVTVTLLAQNAIGYGNLCRLISATNRGSAIWR